MKWALGHFIVHVTVMKVHNSDTHWRTYVLIVTQPCDFGNNQWHISLYYSYNHEKKKVFAQFVWLVGKVAKSLPPPLPPMQCWFKSLSRGCTRSPNIDWCGGGGWGRIWQMGSYVTSLKQYIGPNVLSITSTGIFAISFVKCSNYIFHDCNRFVSMISTMNPFCLWSSFPGVKGAYQSGGSDILTCMIAYHYLTISVFIHKQNLNSKGIGSLHYPNSS